MSWQSSEVGIENIGSIFENSPVEQCECAD